MLDFPGKMSSESEDRSLLAHSESNAQEPAKQSRISYTREFLLSLAYLDAGKQLPTGIEPSILSELDLVFDAVSQSDRGSEYEGLLGNGSLLGLNGVISGYSAPKSQVNSHPPLHKSKEPFRPRCLHKAVNRSGTKNCLDSHCDEKFGSSECLSLKEEEEEKMRRDLCEVTTEGNKQAIEEKQKENPNEHDENSKFGMLLEDSQRNECEKSEECVISSTSVENSVNGASKHTVFPRKKLSPVLMSISVEKNNETKSLTNSLIPENSDLTSNHTKSPAIFWSKFDLQFPVAEKTPTCGISGSEGSESIAHGVSKVLTREPSDDTRSRRGLQTADASSLIQQSSVARSARTDVSEPCKCPFEIADNYVFPSTCGISCSEGSESVAHGVLKDLTREPLDDTGSGKGLQTADASSLIQQSSVARSARNNVSEPCKVPFESADNYVFPSTISEYGFIGIDCEDSMSSSSADQSNSRENELASDDFVAKIMSSVFEPGLKRRPLSCFNERDIFPVELLLPDEDSLITVDDFRYTPSSDKENSAMLMLEGNPVKAERASSDSSIDIWRKLTGLNMFIDEKSTQLGSEGSTSFCNNQELNACKIPAQLHHAQSKQGKTSFGPFDSHPAQAHVSSQMQRITSNYSPHKPSGPSCHPSSTNINPPSAFWHSHANPHQQLQQMLIPAVFLLPHQLIGSPRGAVTPLPGDQSRYEQEHGPIQDFPPNYQSPNHGSFGMPNPGFHSYGSTNDLTFNALLDRTERSAGTGFYLRWP